MPCPERAPWDRQPHTTLQSRVQALWDGETFLEAGRGSCGGPYAPGFGGLRGRPSSVSGTKFPQRPGRCRSITAPSASSLSPTALPRRVTPFLALHRRREVQDLGVGMGSLQCPISPWLPVSGNSEQHPEVLTEGAGADAGSRERSPRQMWMKQERCGGHINYSTDVYGAVPCAAPGLVTNVRSRGGGEDTPQSSQDLGGGLGQTSL